MLAKHTIQARCLNENINSIMRKFFSLKNSFPSSIVHQIGGKANGLLRLQKLGLNVPNWIVIPTEELENTIQNEDKTVLQDLLKEIIDYFENYFGGNNTKNQFLAVRSSAIEEDGRKLSFAGQFETKLFVKNESKELEKAIREVYNSTQSERIKTYKNKLEIDSDSTSTPKIAIIIQEMINADVSGVAFGINPTSGNGSRKETLVNSVFGMGEGLVSGKLESDSFVVDRKDNSIKSTIIKKGNVDIEKQNVPSLNKTQILEINEALKILHKEYGKFQDIEFCIKNDTLYFLQARPITGLQNNFTTQQNGGEYTLWDNSNIVESYPNTTTPLTFSFISSSYKTAYSLFANYMGVDKKIIQENEKIFENTLGFINGRVYYNLKTWYYMLALLPGYSINARFMEKMMGVKERFDIPESQQNYKTSKAIAWWKITKTAATMFIRFRNLAKKRRQFFEDVNKIISEYKQIDFYEKDAHELMYLYLNFEKKLLNEWKAPLLNDFFAMIWYGMLQKRSQKFLTKEQKLSSKYQNIHNDLLCGSSDIISVEPIHRTIKIATFIQSDKELNQLFIKNSAETIWDNLSNKKELIENNNKQQLKQKIDEFINDFGERCVGELKLETISYRQNPAKFIKILKSYTETTINQSTLSNNHEEKIRRQAESVFEKNLKHKFIQKLTFKNTVKKARELVSARENLRYERTRAFGIVREIFTHIGKRFFEESIIESERDIFYMTKEEIFAFIEGRSVTQNIASLIEMRKEEFENYKKLDAPSERFASYGLPYHATDFFSKKKIESVKSTEGKTLKGIGCSHGVVRGKVQVVSNPDELESLNGNILVTRSTDPGWVVLFPSASAILVERGSVLSHSAIVSREMGIPCIVGLSGLLQFLKTGDEIEMDGSTGEVNKIKSQI